MEGSPGLNLVTQGIETPDQPPQSRNGYQPSRHRRPKIAQACEECRARKVRCDGAKPTCNACRRRRKPHPPCVYHSEKVVYAPYVAHLEQRVRELEGRTQGDYPMTSTASSPQPTGHSIDAQNLGKGSAEDNSTRDGILTSPALQDGTDAMGNFGASATFPEASSSAAGFMTQIKSAVAARISSSKQRPSMAMPNRDLPDPWADPRASLLGRSTTELFVLPARRTADEMMEVYWSQVHILYPLLMPQRFNPCYKSLWTGESHDTSEVPMYCIMNLVFAIACQITKRESPQEKAAAADVYYRRAALLLQTSVIGRCSFELLQALLLMGQYLQSTEWPRRCWVVVGHAIRTAQALGLHIPESTAHLPQQDRELMRRLWHGCIFFDRMVSMTLGRPVVISSADACAVPLPIAVDDIHLVADMSFDGHQPEGTVSRTSFFLNSLKLVEILEQILSEMYSARSAVPGYSNSIEKLLHYDFNTILRIDTLFQEWYDSLPYQLRLGGDKPDVTDPTLSRQARVLRLR